MERCIWCGSEKIVTSISEYREAIPELLGWICKGCYDRIPVEDRIGRYIFGYEGFIDEERTVWDEERG